MNMVNNKTTSEKSVVEDSEIKQSVDPIFVSDLQNQIDSLKEQLKNCQNEFEEYKQDNYDKEANLKNRELSIIEKESALTELQEKLNAQQIDIAHQEIALNEKSQSVKIKEEKIDKDEKRLAKLQEKLDKEYQQNLEEITKLRDDIANKQKSDNEKVKNLRKELEEKRINADTELSEWKETEIARIKEEITAQREKMEGSIASNRISLFNNMNEELNRERNSRYAAIEKEIDQKRDELKALEDEKKDFIKKTQDERSEVEKLKAEYEELKRNLERDKDKLAIKGKYLSDREINIDKEVRDKHNELIETYERRLMEKEAFCQNVSKKYNDILKELDAFESLRVIFNGDTAALIQQRINDLENTKHQLETELAIRPGLDVKIELEALRKEKDNLDIKYKDVLDENIQLRNFNSTYRILEMERDRLDNELKYVQGDLKNAHNRIETLQAEISRLTTPASLAEEYDKRVAHIKQAYLIGVENPPSKKELEAENKPSDQPTVDDEIKWLNNISRYCYEYGIVFPKRILYAFHTALKIADWSTLTVLSGVSGTGKSELPRLYSTFGRINFINVPVQPNWDSQESMLGYYNSIDNKFDAQPLLRFLVQCTEELYNCVNIVLLDEMNLAHVEYYFAEFLSKLEQRRGLTYNEVPEIEVKLGAGVQPYLLKLKRNILWCGTMNQDETTKALSDKVLDRGLVINFPRPTELKDRNSITTTIKKIKRIHAIEGRPMLSYDTWRDWIIVDLSKEFSDVQRKEIEKYKNIVQEINNCLGYVGRALGHRVWQSIEFYIANYPEVIASRKEAEGEWTEKLNNAVHIAFEDQLVQKVMPKLRGIDTRGRAKEKCLDKIKDLLLEYDFKLDHDFENAMELGYGQFMWCSAEYIDDKDIAGIEVESNNDKNC